MSIRSAEILRLRFRCDASAPRLARKSLERLEAIMPVREAALLVTSELASNAVMHSGAHSSDEIELKAELVPEGVRIAVTDTGRSDTEPALRPGDHNGPGGFGLRVVQALGRRWGARRNGGLCVWVELPL